MPRRQDSEASADRKALSKPPAPLWKRPPVAVGAALGLLVLVLVIAQHGSTSKQEHLDFSPPQPGAPIPGAEKAASRTAKGSREPGTRGDVGPDLEMASLSGPRSDAWGMWQRAELGPAPRSQEEGEIPVRLVMPTPRGKGMAVTLFGLPSKPRPPEARELPKGFQIQAGAEIDASGWPLEIVCAKDGSELVFVPGGAFTMGRDDGPPEEGPAHRVVLKPFYIGKFEVTMGQYAAYVKRAAAHVLPHQATEAASDPQCPAVGATWNEAAAYAEWAGLRLPTEAQWEKAARGSDARLHPWGPGPALWKDRHSEAAPGPIASEPWDVSPYGCWDMAGSAWEWCSDWFDPTYYAKSPKANPPGPRHPFNTTHSQRVVRGGSPAGSVTWRTGRPLTEWSLRWGFRCVLIPPDKRPVSDAPSPGTAGLPSPGISAVVAPPEDAATVEFGARGASAP